MPLTSDQKRTVAKLAPRVRADFADLFGKVVPSDAAFENAIASAINTPGPYRAGSGPIQTLEYFTLDGNVEGVRVAGPARVRYYRFLAS